jgi:hypothetical protein
MESAHPTLPRTKSTALQIVKTSVLADVTAKAVNAVPTDVEDHVENAHSQELVMMLVDASAIVTVLERNVEMMDATPETSATFVVHFKLAETTSSAEENVLPTVSTLMVAADNAVTTDVSDLAVNVLQSPDKISVAEMDVVLADLNVI